MPGHGDVQLEPLNLLGRLPQSPLAPGLENFALRSHELFDEIIAIEIVLGFPRVVLGSPALPTDQEDTGIVL